MKVNFVSLSGKVFGDEMFVYGKSGRKYRIYNIYLNGIGWLKLIAKNHIHLPKDEEIVIFGKIVNIFGSLGIFVIEYRNVKNFKLY